MGTRKLLNFMPLFICSVCGCVENTALCGYWWQDKDKPVCSEHNPEQGKWHGRFAQTPWNGTDEVLNPPKQDAREQTK